jgi:YfiH family protein
MTTPSPSGPVVLSARRLEAGGRVRGIFTTRLGGVSQGPYASLNVGSGVGDAPDSVLENKRRVAAAFGTGLASLVEAEQVHSNAVAVVGRHAAGSAVPAVDAVVTATRGIWLAIYTADCVPVLVLDPDAPAIAAIHAGWRGTASEIVPEALDRMRAAFGTRPNRCLIALGPAIGGCCYEVDAPVAEAMEQRPWWPLAARPTGLGTWHLDLREAIRRQLEAVGVASDAVEISSQCTRCRPDLFFSYRRDRVTGRMAACIRLSE